MPAEPPAASRGQRRSRCPICRRPTLLEFRPFCSAHCRDQDLANWIGDRYAIPAASSEADDEDGLGPTGQGG